MGQTGVLERPEVSAIRVRRNGTVDVSFADELTSSFVPYILWSPIKADRLRAFRVVRGSGPDADLVFNYDNEKRITNPRIPHRITGIADGYCLDSMVAHWTTAVRAVRAAARGEKLPGAELTGDMAYACRIALQGIADLRAVGGVLFSGFEIPRLESPVPSLA